MTVYDSGDLGDTVYKLPTVRQWAPVHYRLGPYPEGDWMLALREQMTPARAELLLPLLRYQRYIASAEYAAEPASDWLNLNLMRRSHYPPLRVPTRNLADRCACWYHLPEGLWRQAWLRVPAVKRVAKVVFNRTFRYLGNGQLNYALAVKRFGASAVFLGTEHEWHVFCADFGYVPFHPTANLLEVAQVLQGADYFFGNQSVCAALAEGLKRTIFLEVSCTHPDCFFFRFNCRYTYP